MPEIKFPEKDLLRPGEVASTLDVSLRSIYRWIHQGAVDAVKIRGQYRIPRDEAEKLARPVSEDD